jgi:chromosome segregation ATPase
MKKLIIFALCAVFLLDVGAVYAQDGASDNADAPASRLTTERQEINRLKNEKADLTRQLSTARNSIAVSNQEVARLQQEVANYKAQLANAQNSGSANVGLQNERDNAVNARNNLNQQYNILSEDFRALSAKYNRLKSKVLEEDAPAEQPMYKDSSAPEVKGEVKKTAKGRIVGQDAQGRNIYEDANGARYYNDRDTRTKVYIKQAP